MPSGSDLLTNIFLFTFLFGLVFTIVSLVLGVTHMGSLDSGHATHIHIGHLDFHLGDAGHAGHAGHIGHVDTGAAHAGHLGDAARAAHAGTHVENTSSGDSDGPGIFNMPTIMAFLTWFGAAGYILSRSLGLGGCFTVPAALTSGLMGGAIMFTLLARLLWPMMSKPLSSADYKLPGTPARVVSPIREGGVGEIVYTKKGTRFTTGARSVEAKALARGDEVVIIKYEHGIAYVQSVRDILGQEGGDVNPA